VETEPTRPQALADKENELLVTVRWKTVEIMEGRVGRPKRYDYAYITTPPPASPFPSPPCFWVVEYDGDKNDTV
jgi:hypothetical protein